MLYFSPFVKKIRGALRSLFWTLFPNHPHPCNFNTTDTPCVCLCTVAFGGPQTTVISKRFCPLPRKTIFAPLGTSSPPCWECFLQLKWLSQPRACAGRGCSRGHPRGSSGISESRNREYSQQWVMSGSNPGPYHAAQTHRLMKAAHFWGGW